MHTGSATHALQHFSSGVHSSSHICHAGRPGLVCAGTTVAAARCAVCPEVCPMTFAPFRARSRRRIATCARMALVVIGCLAGSVRPLMAGVDRAKPINQYSRTVWEAGDGLPQNTVQTVLQTRDGYVWLGTEEGLVRFDGERFEEIGRASCRERE